MYAENGENRDSCDEFVDEYSSLIVHENPADDDTPLDDIPPWTSLEIAVTGLAVVIMIASIGILVIESTLISLVVGVVGLIVPPYVAFQEQKITDCKAMMETSEVMTQELDNLTHENEHLSKETEKIKTSVLGFQSLADTFEEIRAMEDSSLDIIEDQLVQMKEILQQMKENKLNVVLGNLFDILLAIDIDGNMTLSEDEIENLIKSCESIHNVDINENLFRELVPIGSHIEDVMKIVKDVLDDDPTTGSVTREHVFTIL